MKKRSMSSHDYWKAREENNLRHYEEQEQGYNRKVDDLYQAMIDECNRDIEAFYAKYAKTEGITLAEAKRRAAKLDIEAYGRKAKRYVKEKNFSPQANEEMKLYNMTMKVNRLELLKSELSLEMTACTDATDKYYSEIFDERAREAYERQAGVLGKTVPDEKTMDRMADNLVHGSFQNSTIDGSYTTFSERIWVNQDALRSAVMTELTRGMIKGLNPRELARSLNKKMKAGRYNAERLMRTELARIQIGAQQQAISDAGYDSYEFIATEGAHTCDVCRSLDGKKFKLRKMVVGENAPPMHPFCRCSVAAAMSDEEFRKLTGVDPVNNRPRQPEINVNQMNASEADSVGRGVIYKHWEEYRQKFLGHAAPVDFNRLDTSMYDKVNLGAYKDMETVSKILTTVNNLSSDFYSPLQSLRWMDKTESLSSRAFASTTHMWGYGSAEIRFNPVKLSEKGIERIAELSANGYAVNIPKGREVDYIVAHEFGHSILNIGEKLPTKSNNFVQCDFRAVKAARGEIEKLWDSYTADVGKAYNEYEEMRKALDSKFIFKMIPPTDEERKTLSALKATMESKRISAYSMSNIDEFVAEAFADVRINEQNASEHSKQVYGVLSKYFGKGGE